LAELHTIKAHLYDNALTENPNDFIARAASEKSLTVADICQTAVKRGGADISAASMEHGVNLWLKEMAYRLCDGFAVHTGCAPVRRDKHSAVQHCVRLRRPPLQRAFVRFGCLVGFGG
jgi:hypothetical protein